MSFGFPWKCWLAFEGQKSGFKLKTQPNPGAGKAKQRGISIFLEFGNLYWVLALACQTDHCANSACALSGGPGRGGGVLLSAIRTCLHLSEQSAGRVLWCSKPDHAGLDESCYRIIKPEKKKAKEIYASTSDRVGLEQMQNGKVIKP